MYMADAGQVRSFRRRGLIVVALGDVYALTKMPPAAGGSATRGE
jgi:hypothetical protein